MLNTKGNKKDKINAITAEVLWKIIIKTVEDILGQQDKDEEQEISDSDYESDQDIVLEVFGSDSETKSESESELLPTVEPVPLVVKTRYDVTLETAP